MTEYHCDYTIDEILEREKLEYVEQKDFVIREDELKDPHRAIKIELLGIIAAYQEPVCCNKIFRDFFEINGYDLDPHTYGFKSFSSMMRTFSDKFISHTDGMKTTYTAKKTERSSHLQELIKNQVTIEERRRRDMRKSRSHSRRRGSYGAGIFYAQNFVPLLEDDRTLEQRTADNLASFGRSLAAAAGLDWGGRQSRIDDSTSGDDSEGGVILRSRSMPASRDSPVPLSMPLHVLIDPASSDLDDCTNPFRVLNNVRIRDIVINHGEADDDGRKGMALVDLASRFRKEHRQPLGGAPGLSEEKLMTKMSAVVTSEWEVARMGDGVAYCIVPVETIKKAQEVGPGSPTAQPQTPEKPRLSPEGKRSFAFNLKAVLSHNARLAKADQQRLKERAEAAAAKFEFTADSDGDPVMTEVPEGAQQKETAFDRTTMMALKEHDTDLDKNVEMLAFRLRIHSSQASTPKTGSPSGSSSSHSSLGSRGRTGHFQPAAERPRGPPSTPINPSEPSSSMWGQQSSSGFGGGSASFGTFGSSQPPADKGDDSSGIIQPSASNLAFKLPTSSFPGSFQKDMEDSGYSESQVSQAESSSREETALRREMRARLGIASDDEDDVSVEKGDEKRASKKEHSSPPMYPPGLAPRTAPPGMPAHPAHSMYHYPGPGQFVWVPAHHMMHGCPPLSSPMSYLVRHHAPAPSPLFTPPGLFPPGMPPGLMTGPPPGLWIAPPPFLSPPGLTPPPLPDTERPVEYKGEVYYGKPDVWPPPIKSEQERVAEKRDKKCLTIEAPPDPSLPAAAPALSGPMPSFGTRANPLVQTATSPTPAPRATAAPTPSFGGGAAAVAPAPNFPSAFGAAPKPAAAPSVPTPAPAAAPKKSDEKPTGNELLGATIQLIGKLRGGTPVYMREIEETPVEDVVAGNPDFFDIDEKDERIHLLHRDVDPNLLMVDGQQLGTMVAEEQKEKAQESRAALPAPAKAGSFSVPPTFTRGTVREMPTFGGNLARPAPKVVESEENDRPASSISVRSEQTLPRSGMPTFGGVAVRKPMVEVVAETSFARPAEKAPTAVPIVAKPLAGMPSFGTRSTELQRPDSALSNRSEEPSKQVREAPTFGGARPPVQRKESTTTTSEDSEAESIQESKYGTAASTLSSRNGSSMLSVASSIQDTEEAEGEKTPKIEQPSTGPFTFPIHRDMNRLTKKTFLALDSIRKGQLHLASTMTSFAPNRLLMTLHEGNMMARLQTGMRDLTLAYADQKPLDTAVELGQFAVAINGECIVRVVVLRRLNPEEDLFECACLDINAMINVAGDHLYPLLDRFGVHALRSSTFIARINGISELESTGHRAIKLIIKSEENDDSVKMPQPFVFHGKSDMTGDLVVDVAAVIAGGEVAWISEALSRVGIRRSNDALVNPNIESAVDFANKLGLADYPKMKKSRVSEHADTVTPTESDLDTLRSESPMEKRDESVMVVKKVEEEEKTMKEDGELDTSHSDSTTSERTTVDRQAAGVADFVRREKKVVQPDDEEFVIVAPAAVQPIVNVESITSLIRLFNSKGQHVEVDVLKSMCRAMILSTNKTLSTMGERGALIANAEALEAIDMA